MKYFLLTLLTIVSTQMYAQCGQTCGTTPCNKTPKVQPCGVGVHNENHCTRMSSHETIEHSKGSISLKDNRN